MGWLKKNWKKIAIGAAVAVGGSIALDKLTDGKVDVLGTVGKLFKVNQNSGKLNIFTGKFNPLSWATDTPKLFKVNQNTGRLNIFSGTYNPLSWGASIFHKGKPVATPLVEDKQGQPSIPGSEGKPEIAGASSVPIQNQGSEFNRDHSLEIRGLDALKPQLPDKLPVSTLTSVPSVDTPKIKEDPIFASGADAKAYLSASEASFAKEYKKLGATKFAEKYGASSVAEAMEERRDLVLSNIDIEKGDGTISGATARSLTRVVNGYNPLDGGDSPDEKGKGKTEIVFNGRRNFLGEVLNIGGAVTGLPISKQLLGGSSSGGDSGSGGGSSNGGNGGVAQNNGAPQAPAAPTQGGAMTDAQIAQIAMTPQGQLWDQQIDLALGINEKKLLNPWGVLDGTFMDPALSGMGVDPFLMGTGGFSMGMMPPMMPNNSLYQSMSRPIV